MPDNKKQPEFTVTDRRRFTAEGEAAPETPEPPRAEVSSAPEAAPAGKAEGPAVPPPPSAAERQAQHDAFNASKKQLDAQLQSELGGRRVQDFEMTFERFVASLYMNALMQLGLMHEQGAPPQVDLIGARQAVDSIGILAEKTKGNLTLAEDNLLQNCLYELRMAYVEVTNALAHAPQGPAPGAPGGKK